MQSSFLCPGGAELWATIAAGKVAGVAEIYFHIAGNGIFSAIAVGNVFKVHCCPWLTAAIMSITELTKILHVPTVLTFCWSLPLQHQLSLLYFVLRVVYARRRSLDVRHLYFVQWRMITTIGMTSGQVQAYLLPLC